MSMDTVFKNTSVLFTAHFISRTVAFLLLILLSRYFDENQLGAYFVAVAFTNLIASVTELGMRAPLVREIAIFREETSQLLSNAFIIRVISSIIAFLIMVGTAILLGYSEFIQRLIWIVGLSEVINSMARLFRSVFRAYEQMKYEAIVVVIERLCVALIGGALVIYGVKLPVFCTVILGASGINLAISAGIALKKFARLSLKIDFSIWKRLMAQALPFALGSIFNLVYFRIDTIMLERLSPDAEVSAAWYGFAYSLTTAITILPGAFMGAMFPVMSRAYGKQKSSSDFQKLYTQAVKLMFIIGLPIALGLSMLSYEITSVLWPDYDRGTIDAALKFLGWTCGLIFLSTVIVTGLRALDKRLGFTLLIGTTTALNIGLNFYLIPRYSHVGASITMIFTESYLLIAGLMYIGRKVAFPNEFSFIPKSVFGALCMGLFLLLLRDKLYVFIITPLAGIVYFGIMLLFDDIRKTFRVKRD